MFTKILPLTFSSDKFNVVSSLTPLPNQLFSFTENIKLVPSVPIPAPAIISPVAFSSTDIFITLRSSEEPGDNSYSTLPKIFLDFISFMDLLTRRVLKGSPSSTISALLITESFVTEFPVIFIRSIITFSPSKILILTSTPVSSNVSSTL